MLSRRTVLASAAGLILAGPVRAQPSRIPFEHANGKVFAPAMVNGVPVQAMLDSGSAFYGVDTGFAALAGITPAGRRVSLRGVQRNLTGRFGDMASLSVGDTMLADTRALVVDYASLTATVGREIEMALGGAFFRQFVVDLDFDDLTMAITEREAFAPPGNATLVPLKPARDLMTAPVIFPDGTVLSAIVDSGSEPALIVSPRPARALKLFGPQSATAPLGGIGGGAIVKVGTAPKVSIGGHWFDDVPVQGVSRSLGTDANLGLELLAQFRVWFDFGGRRMWLRPRAEAVKFRRDLLGLYGEVRADAIRVTHVSRKSPAAATGFREGEVFTAINGIPAVQANLMFREAEAGTALTFTLADGTTRALTLARYY